MALYINIYQSYCRFRPHEDQESRSRTQWCRVDKEFGITRRYTDYVSIIHQPYGKSPVQVLSRLTNKGRPYFNNKKPSFSFITWFKVRTFNESHIINPNIQIQDTLSVNSSPNEWLSTLPQVWRPALKIKSWTFWGLYLGLKKKKTGTDDVTRPAAEKKWQSKWQRHLHKGARLL